MRVRAALCGRAGIGRRNLDIDAPGIEQAAQRGIGRMLDAGLARDIGHVIDDQRHLGCDQLVHRGGVFVDVQVQLHVPAQRRDAPRQRQNSVQANRPGGRGLQPRAADACRVKPA